MIAKIIVNNLDKLNRRLIVEALRNARNKNLTYDRNKPDSKHKAVMIVRIKGRDIFVVGGEQTIRDFAKELERYSKDVELVWDWDNPVKQQKDLVEDYGFPEVPTTLKLGKAKNNE